MRTLLTLLAALTLSLAVAGSVVKAHGPTSVTYVEKPCYYEEETRRLGWCDGDIEVRLRFGSSHGDGPIISGEWGRSKDRRRSLPQSHAIQDITQHYSWFGDWEWDADEDSLSEFGALLMNRFVPADAWADQVELKVELVESAADLEKRCSGLSHGCLAGGWTSETELGPNTVRITIVQVHNREGKIAVKTFLHLFAGALENAIYEPVPDGRERDYARFHELLARVWDEFVGYDLRPYYLFWGVPCS